MHASGKSHKATESIASSDRAADRLLPMPHLRVASHDRATISYIKVLVYLVFRATLLIMNHYVHIPIPLATHYLSLAAPQQRLLFLIFLISTTNWTLWLNHDNFIIIQQQQ